MAIRFYGLFRNGLTEPVAKIAHSAVKRLFKKSPQSEGALAGYCQSKITDHAWQQALDLLVTCELVEAKDVGQGLRVSITRAGAEFGSELLAKDVIESPDYRDRLAAPCYWRPDSNPDLAECGVRQPTAWEQLDQDQLRDALNRGILSPQFEYLVK